VSISVLNTLYSIKAKKVLSGRLIVTPRRPLGLLLRVHKKNAVNGVWWKSSAAFCHCATSGAERSLTRSAGGRYCKHLTGKRRQLRKLMPVAFPPSKDVTIRCIEAGLYVCSCWRHYHLRTRRRQCAASSQRALLRCHCRLQFLHGTPMQLYQTRNTQLVIYCHENNFK